MPAPSSLFRPKLLLPAILAVFFTTPIPTRLGIWKYLLGLHPGGAGLLPCQFPNGSEDWSYTFEQLYGDGPNTNSGDDDALAYRNRLWGQTALVTGANSGTGYEISLALARLGARVTMACRNSRRCEDARQTILEDPQFVGRAIADRGLAQESDRSAYIEVGIVDTSSLESVQRFSRGFLESLDGNPLDMLFLNAGISGLPLNSDGTNVLSRDGIEMLFATNVVGHHLLYKLLEPSIVHKDRTTPARIVLTSSAASFLKTPWGYALATDLERLNGDPQTDMSHYSQSKLAQILWARELTAKLDSSGDASAGDSKDDPNAVVYANAGHVGAAATNIWMTHWDKVKEADARDNAGFLKRAHTAVSTAVVKWMLSNMWTSAEGALTLVYLGTALEDLREHNYRGRYFHPQAQLITTHENVYANETETNILQADLWEFLDELVAEFV